MLYRPNSASVLGNDQGSFGSGQVFPADSFNAGNYYSDVVVDPTAAHVVGSTYLNQASVNSSMAVTLPTDLVDGDQLFVAAVFTDTNLGTVVTESKTGWTTVTAKSDVGTTQRVLYTATYSSSLVAPSWTLSAPVKSAYVCVAVRNGQTYQEAHADGGGLTSTAPSIASAPVGISLRIYTRKDNLSGSVTAPTGATLITGALGVATGPSAHMLAYTTPQATAGASGTAVTTWPVTSVNSCAWTIAL
jgi:hypothetical protein